MTRTLVALAGLACAAAFAAPRWEVQYFYDQAKSSLTITDIVFPSAQRGLASGFVMHERSVKPVVLVTSDGGQKWTQLPAPDSGVSLFCLDESACWMVTAKGLYFSDEMGRAWRRVRGEQGVTGVYFLTRQHGWIFGARKKLLETHDGGKSWKQVPEATALKTSQERTVFYSMAFLSDKSGILTGRSEPLASRRAVPIWAETDPETEKERPTLTLLLETRDSGQTWSATSASMFGRFSRISRAGEKGSALGLIEFDKFFNFPSEVYRYDFAGGKLTRAFRMTNVAITDVAMTQNGTGVIAGFEPPGRLARTPVPGKLHIYTSRDYTTWSDSYVDYRAVARLVRLAVVDDSHMWAATDTGMILRLVR
jgi:photosystem II stability/assembly factor-like uncharacterized protein